MGLIIRGMEKMRQMLFAYPDKQKSPDLSREIAMVNHGCCFGRLKRDYEVIDYA